MSMLILSSLIDHGLKRLAILHDEFLLSGWKCLLKLYSILYLRRADRYLGSQSILSGIIGYFTFVNVFNFLLSATVYEWMCDRVNCPTVYKKI